MNIDQKTNFYNVKVETQLPWQLYVTIVSNSNLKQAAGTGATGKNKATKAVPCSIRNIKHKLTLATGWARYEVAQNTG